jgi:hypothetical protein
MHLFVALWALISAWKWGDWRNWEKYHPTLMYFAMGNLLYNFLTANHFLWKLEPDFLPNHSMTEMVYTFITFPATAFLFLSNYPKETHKIFLHYLKWIFIFVAVEWVFSRTGRILYQYGWSLGWSAIFDCTMFPMLWLFYRKPLIAYGISAIMCVFWVWLFDVPVNVPIELRK